VDARPVARHDAQEAVAVGMAQLQVTDHEVIRDGDVLREAAHPLERDPRLIAAGRADRYRCTRRAEQVVNGDQRRRRRLGVAARQDRCDLARLAEVRPCDPALERRERLADLRAEGDEAGETGRNVGSCLHN